MRATVIPTVFLISSLLCGCASRLTPESFDPGTPIMRPEVFFAGATHSFGVMETPSGAPTRLFHVTGQGRPQPDGGFRLDQTVAFDGKPPERRTWIMRASGRHDYRASLSDASGQVAGEAHGNLFHLHYRLKAIGRMDQWLYLQPDGRTVLNEATVTVAGVVVARLSERISRDTSDGAER